MLAGAFLQPQKVLVSSRSQHAQAPQGQVRLAGTRCRRIRARSDQSIDQEELTQLLGEQFLRPQYEEYSDEHVSDLVEAAAGLISVLDDLRPLDASSFNAAYEIWKAIAAVPPADRVRILDELEPGAIFSLWRASIGRYVLDEGRSTQLFDEFFIWDDFPSQPGEVYTYEGICEQFTYQKPANPLSVDSSMQARHPRATPWLKPSPASMAAPQDRFRQQFFLANRTGLLHSRMLLSPPAPFSFFSFLSPPVYSRVEIGLTLVPNQADAGADVALTYPADPTLLKQQQAAGIALSKEDLPSALWPAPMQKASWSPLSFSGRDYMRAAGPGFYVGCGYRTDEAGNYLEEEHVYFALVRAY